MLFGWSTGGEDYDTSRSKFAAAHAARRDQPSTNAGSNGTPINALRQACLARGACGIKSLGRYLEAIFQHY